MKVLTASILDISVPTSDPRTPCWDCVLAYGAVVEMGLPTAPLPIIAQAVAVWPADTGPAQLCGHHAYTRSVDQALALARSAEAVAA